jgi:hypothetical protein
MTGAMFPTSAIIMFHSFCLPTYPQWCRLLIFILSELSTSVLYLHSCLSAHARSVFRNLYVVTYDPGKSSVTNCARLPNFIKIILKDNFYAF